MSDSCNVSSSCSTCPSAASCETAQKPPVDEGNQYSNVKNVIAVMSGKGGVGKSSVAALLASHLRKAGYKVGVLDADITGPSIPKMFGTEKKLAGNPDGIIPPKTKSGIKVMSINLFLENENDPVVWRGPIIGNAIQQFWTDVLWGELDYLIVDLPPGTGDAPLTVMQSLPLKGVVIVSSPQDLAMMVVKKAIKMVQIMDKPILGLIENMAYVECPDCGKKIYIFGESKAQELADELNVSFLGSLPINPDISELCDAGKIEDYESDLFKRAVETITKKG
ncbi:MAG: Mrp/NBP35 family ATP-binding protein [Firmicutes bacterium]|nr:Mrp/NBP35 family ATP-binding protein [Bacillota bacterium]